MFLERVRTVKGFFAFHPSLFIYEDKSLARDAVTSIESSNFQPENMYFSLHCDLEQGRSFLANHPSLFLCENESPDSLQVMQEGRPQSSSLFFLELKKAL